jgi:hypothetical protein
MLFKLPVYKRLNGLEFVVFLIWNETWQKKYIIPVYCYSLMYVCTVCTVQYIRKQSTIIIFSKNNCAMYVQYVNHLQ